MNASAVEAKGCGCGFDHQGFDCGELELVPAEEVGGCSCGAKFYDRDDLYEHECLLDPEGLNGSPVPSRRFETSEPVATLVPGRPGSLTTPPTSPRTDPLIFTRDDGGLNIHPPYPGPANCCDGRMVMIFVNRNGSSLCPSCDAERHPS